MLNSVDVTVTINWIKKLKTNIATNKFEISTPKDVSRDLVRSVTHGVLEVIDQDRVTASNVMLIGTNIANLAIKKGKY